MKFAMNVDVGPIAFRIGSSWQQPIAQLQALYDGYPHASGIADYTVRLEPARPWRRFVRPSVRLRGDHMLPDALPLPLAQGLLAAEMGMNLQLALGERRYLLLHAAALERDGRALILTGESGSGKSTLAALLGEAGWRYLGDEFVLVSPETGMLHPFPRPASLKNESIAALEAVAPPERFGPLLTGTPKGSVRHLRPQESALQAMHIAARPSAILFPRYGFAADVREVAPAETFVRLTQASTNYTALGERGFAALARLVTTVRATAVDYPDTATAMAMIDAL